MENIEIIKLVETICNVYKNRGYVSIDEIQSKLDEHEASLIETNKIMRLLDENGCRISTTHSDSNDFSLYDGSFGENGKSIQERFSTFIEKEKINCIDGLEYQLQDYETGVLYYIYLRLILRLSKASAAKHVINLQEAYNIYLDSDEDKIIFNIQSAEYVQKIMVDLHDKKKHKKVKQIYKTAVGNYQHFLEQNMHSVIARCEEILFE